MRKIKVKSHERDGTKVSAHTREISLKPASYGANNRSPINNKFKLPLNSDFWSNKKLKFENSFKTPNGEGVILDTKRSKKVDSVKIETFNPSAIGMAQVSVRFWEKISNGGYIPVDEAKLYLMEGDNENNFLAEVKELVNSRI